MKKVKIKVTVEHYKAAEAAKGSIDYSQRCLLAQALSKKLGQKVQVSFKDFSIFATPGLIALPRRAIELRQSI